MYTVATIYAMIMICDVYMTSQQNIISQHNLIRTSDVNIVGKMDAIANGDSGMKALSAIAFNCFNQYAITGTERANRDELRAPDRERSSGKKRTALPETKAVNLAVKEPEYQPDSLQNTLRLKVSSQALYNTTFRIAIHPWPLRDKPDTRAVTFSKDIPDALNAGTQTDSFGSGLVIRNQAPIARRRNEPLSHF
jgi:hypothetical protein